MARLRSVYYRTLPNPDHPRRHVIPVDAARYLLDEPGALPSCLNDHRLLAQVTLVARNEVLAVSREFILAPAGENVVTFPDDVFPGAPSPFPEDAYLVVRLVLLTGPAGQEPTPEI